MSGRHPLILSTPADSDIVESSVVVNPLPAFLRSYPRIKLIGFNGAKAAALFARHVAPALPSGEDLAFRRLPSTSPANAAIPLKDKISEWGSVLRAV
jgi:double-stranded uracil-DNA glycosylase